MAQVNYVREMESFSVYAEANGLTASERLVWLGLFHLFNGRAFASEWPDGYIEIRRADLIAAAGVSKNTVLRARESLAKRGLIDYTIGGGDGGSRYKMAYLSVYGAPEKDAVAADGGRLPQLQHEGRVIDKVVSVEEKDGGISVKAVRVDPSHGGTTPEKGAHGDPSHDGTTPSQDGTTPSRGGTTKTEDVVTTENINPTVNIELNQEEEEIYNNKSTARARAGESGDVIGEAFLNLIGRKASPVEIHDIGEIAAWCRAEDALILEALRRAGEAGAQSAGRYVTKCLMRWSDQDVRTVEELETWERLDELSRSARPDIAAKGEERLRAYVTELKIKHRTVNAI